MKLNKYFLSTIALLSVGFAVGQTDLSRFDFNDGFDYKSAYQQAQDKGITATDIDGYMKALHNEYVSHSGHNHGVQNQGTIYLNGNNAAGRPAAPAPIPGPNTPQNQYCPNAGFEQLNFANWTGGDGLSLIHI